MMKMRFLVTDLSSAALTFKMSDSSQKLMAATKRLLPNLNELGKTCKTKKNAARRTWLVKNRHSASAIFPLDPEALRQAQQTANPSDEQSTLVTELRADWTFANTSSSFFNM